MLYSPDSAAVNVFSTFSTCDISTLDDNFLQIFTETGIAFLLSFTDWLFFFFWPWRTDIKEPLQWVRQSSQLPGYQGLPWHGSLCPCISAEIRTHHSACAVSDAAPARRLCCWNRQKKREIWLFLFNRWETKARRADEACQKSDRNLKTATNWIQVYWDSARCLHHLSLHRFYFCS